MIPNFDIDVLKTFLAIARNGSFTAAAEEVNKTQGAVSMQMKRLEEMIGRSLFIRDGRQNRLSIDGERMLDHAERLVRLNDEAAAHFLQPEVTGAVKLGTPDDYSDAVLPEVLARFSRTHPLVEVVVECFNSTTLQEKISKGDLDLAVVSCEESMSGAEIIRREPLVWVTSARHCVHESSTLPIALSQRGCIWRTMLLNALEESGRQYRIAYASHNASAIGAAVVSGLAVSALPPMIIRPGMRELTPAEGFAPLGSFDLGLLRHDTNGQSEAVNVLAQHIRDSLGNINQIPRVAAE